jgi:glucose-1-phosphate thymidylyltransferase
VSDPQSYGVAELEDGASTRLVEKPAEPRSDLALVGVYLFTPAKIFESVKAIAPSARGELEITDAIQHMVDRGLRVEPHIVTGWWKDTGKLEDMLEANRLILGTIERDVRGETIDCTLEGPVADRRRQRLTRCTVRGPSRSARLPAHRRLHRPVHRDQRRRRRRAGRDRALHHPREQPHLPAGGAHGRQPHRARRA